MNFRNMRVKMKLMLGFAVLAAIVLLVSGLSLRSLARSNDRFDSYLQGVEIGRASCRERVCT